MDSRSDRYEKLTNAADELLSAELKNNKKKLENKDKKRSSDQCIVQILQESKVASPAIREMAENKNDAEEHLQFSIDLLKTEIRRVKYGKYALNSMSFFLIAFSIIHIGSSVHTYTENENHYLSVISFLDPTKTCPNPYIDENSIIHKSCVGKGFFCSDLVGGLIEWRNMISGDISCINAINQMLEGPGMWNYYLIFTTMTMLGLLLLRGMIAIYKSMSSNSFLSHDQSGVKDFAKHYKVEIDLDPEKTIKNFEERLSLVPFPREPRIAFLAGAKSKKSPFHSFFKEGGSALCKDIFLMAGLLDPAKASKKYAGKS